MGNYNAVSKRATPIPPPPQRAKTSRHVHFAAEKTKLGKHSAYFTIIISKACIINIKCRQKLKPSPHPTSRRLQYIYRNGLPYRLLTPLPQWAISRYQLVTWAPTAHYRTKKDDWRIILFKNRLPTKYCTSHIRP